MARQKKTDRQPAPKTPAPSAGYVLGLYRNRLQLGDEAELRSDIFDFRALTGMTHLIPIPNQYQATTTTVRTPFIRDSWLRVTAALTQNPPVAQALGRDDTQDARRAAEIAQRWTMAAFKNMDRPAGDDVIYNMVKALVRDSEGVIKVVMRGDAYANFPRREPDEDPADYLKRFDQWDKSGKRRDPSQKIFMPFAWRVVDRLQMLFGEGEFGDDWALEYGEYPRSYLSVQYGMYENSEGTLVPPDYYLGGQPKPEGFLLSSTGKAIKYEYWDADWWAVVVDGHMAPGWPKRNPYSPWLPYFRAKVEERPLKALKFLGPALDALLTMKLNWAFLSAYPNPVVTTLPQQVAPGLDLPTGEFDEAGRLVWIPGKALELPVGKDIKFLAPPPVGRDLDMMAGQLRDLIDVAGVPSVFRGVGGSDQAGYAINQLIAAANLTYKTLATVSQANLERLTKFLWWLVEHRIGQTVYVLEEGDEDQRQWLGLRPTGKVTTTEAPLDAVADVEFKFRPVLPTDEQARAMMATQMVNSPKQMISKRYALEHYLQVDDPDGMMDDIWVEKMMEDDPMLNQRVVTEALTRAGLVSQAGPANPSSLGPAGPGGPGPLPIGQPPGQAGAGTPSVPGLNQPLQPGPPGTPPIAGGTGARGGRPAGMFPGRPGQPAAPFPPGAGG